MPFHQTVQTTLRAKIILLTCAFAVIASVSVVWLNGSKAREVVGANVAVSTLSNESQKVAIRLEEDFVDMVQDARIVSLTPPITGMIRSRETGTDPVDGSTYDLWRSRLATIFTSVMEERPSYTQMRYIALDDSGSELVRVNREANGTLAVVDESQLQTKAGEPYFQAALSLEKGESMFSEVSFNREHGEVTQAYVPTIRSVVPVYSAEGDAYGLIVINADYEALLQESLSRIAPNFDLFIFHTGGDVFEYNAATGNTRYIPNGAASGQLRDYQSLFEDQEEGPLYQFGDDILFSTWIEDFSDARGLHLDVVLRASRAAVLFASRESFVQVAGLAIALILGSLICAALIADRMTNPLRRMTRRIKQYTDWSQTGDLYLPVDHDDEIGDLSRAFSDLVSQLQDSQARSANIILNAVDGVIVVDQKGVIETFNPACERIFGYKADDVVGQNISHLLTEDAVATIKAFATRLATTAGAPGVQLRARHRNGSEFPMEVSLSEMRQKGQVYFCGIIRDLTQVVADREAFEKQAETLELALQAGELGLWDWNLTTGKITFSKRCAEIGGYTLDEFPVSAKEWEAYLHEDDMEVREAFLREFIAGKRESYELEYRFRHRNGHWVWLQTKGRIFERDEDGKPVRVVGVHLDVSSRKQYELDIIEQNRRLELAENVADMGHWSVDVETGDWEWSDAVCQLHGVDKERFSATLASVMRCYHPDDATRFTACLVKAFGQNDPFELPLRVLRPDGEVRQLLCRGEVMTDASNAGRKSVFGIFQDITEKKRKDQRLRESEEKNRMLLANMVDGVLTVDASGRIDSYNRACAEIFGYDTQELLGRDVSLLMPEAAGEARRAGSVYFLELSAEDVQRTERPLELTGHRKDGELFTLELAFSVFEVAGRRLFTCVLRDITERKQMETMKNEFVSTVNHELRTPLTSIYGALDLLKSAAKDQLDARCNRLVTLAHDGCGRLTHLVNDILDLEKIEARKMEYRLEPVRLTSVVDDIVRRHEVLEDRFNVHFVIDHEIGDAQVRLHGGA